MPEITHAQLENNLKQAIKIKTDTVMDSVKCKGPLSAKIGATQYCVATAEADGTSGGRPSHDYINRSRHDQPQH